MDEKGLVHFLIIDLPDGRDNIISSIDSNFIHFLKSISKVFIKYDLISFAKAPF